MHPASSNGTLHQSGKLITKKGLKYLKLEDPIIKIDVGDIKEYKFDGLFGGNEVLGILINYQFVINCCCC